MYELLGAFESILVVILQPLLQLAAILFVSLHYHFFATLISQHDKGAAEDEEQIDHQVQDDKSNRDISEVELELDILDPW